MIKQPGECAVTINGLISPFANNDLMIQFEEEKIEVAVKEDGANQIATLHFEIH